VRELIRNDEKRKAEDRLTALLREGLQSEETALTSEDWKAIRAEALARVKHAAKRKR
jgi:antitoxin ParD1/3/4